MPSAAAVASLALLLTLLLAPVAAAHPALVQSSPAAGALVERAPERVILGLSEPVRRAGSAVEVRDARGRRVPVGPLRVWGLGALAVDVARDLAPGVYTVRWTAVGADGHATGGTFAFAVPRADGSPPPGIERLGAAGVRDDEQSRGDGAALVLIRWLGLLAGALLSGGAALRARLRTTAPAISGSLGGGASRLALGIALVGAFSAAASAAAAATAGAGPGSAAALLSGGGALAVVRFALFIGGPVVALRAGAARGDVILGIAGAAALVTQALDGHVLALAGPHVVASVEAAAHVLAAGLWFGGIAALLGALARGVPGKQAVRAFAPLAGAATAVLAVTGVLAAIREVGDDYFLRWSAYGHVVLIKAALLVVLVALGARAAAVTRRGADPRRLLRGEAAGAGVVLLLAAALAGLVQGRGQPLGAQRGNLLGGAALATATTGDALVHLTVAPALPGPNVVAATVSALRAGAPTHVPATLRVRLGCMCASRAVVATLRRAPHQPAWHARVRLPAQGTWLATVATERGDAPPVALAVGDPGASGPGPAEVVETADLSGRDAARCRAQSQGLALAIARLNAAGGLDGRKVALRAHDDGGDPARAAAIARRAGGAGAVALAAPCGAGAPGALRATPRLPALVADPAVPLVARPRLWRLAGDPRAEGEAVGRYIDREGLVAGSHRPRRVIGVVAGPVTPDIRDRLTTLRRTLGRAHVALHLLSLPERGDAAAAAARRALDARRALAVVLDGDEARLARALRAAGRDPALVPPAVIAASPLLDEDFQVAAGTLGREGAIRSPAEVSPDSRDALGYAAAVTAIFPGDRPSIAGLRGFVAGLALAEALRDGTQPERIAARLRRPRRFTDALQAPWRAQAPQRGGVLFGFLAPRFLPANLIPVSAGGEQFTGRWFPDGAWTRTTGEVYGPPL